MTHEQVRELLPAFALDALADDEMREVLTHLTSCDECRRELASLREVTDQLAAAVTQVSTPNTLRDAVFGTVRSTAKIITLTRGWAVSLGAAAAILIIALAAVNVSLNQQLSALSSRLTAQEQVLVLLASPSTSSVVLAGEVRAAVRLVYDPSRGRGALVVSDLGDPGRGFVYQLWLVTGTQPESAGVFLPVPGRPLVLPVAADFARYQAVAISIERAPSGAPQPTSTPILVGKI